MDAMYLARHAKGKDPNIDQAALAPALNGKISFHDLRRPYPHHVT